MEQDLNSDLRCNLKKGLVTVTANVYEKFGDYLGQSLHFQSIQVLLNRFCGILEAQPVILRRRCDYSRSQIQQMKHELVRVLRLNAESYGGLRRKIARVKGD